MNANTYPPRQTVYTKPLQQPVAAGFLTDWHAFSDKQNVPLIPQNAQECTTLHTQCCCSGSPLGLLNVAGIAGSCAVCDEALTQSFHLAQCKHRCVHVCVYLCISAPALAARPLWRLLIGPFSLWEFANMSTLDTVQYVRVQFVHECLVMCLARIRTGFFLLTWLC